MLWPLLALCLVSCAVYGICWFTEYRGNAFYVRTSKLPTPKNISGDSFAELLSDSIERRAKRDKQVRR